MGSLGQGGRLAAVHKQTGQVQGLSLEILVQAAQASKVEEVGIGDVSFLWKG